LFRSFPKTPALADLFASPPAGTGAQATACRFGSALLAFCPGSRQEGLVHLWDKPSEEPLQPIVVALPDVEPRKRDDLITVLAAMGTADAMEQIGPNRSGEMFRSHVHDF
jgi:hypothetical protein